MSRSVFANWKYSDLQFIVDEARQTLNRGSERFTNRRNIPSRAISHTVTPPSQKELMFSDRSISCGDEQIEAEYFEEVRLLANLMSSHKVPNKAKATIGAAATQTFLEAIHYQSHAMTMWDIYAIPWRIRGEKVFIINQPRDLSGSPVIYEMDRAKFQSEQLHRLASAEGEIQELGVRLDRWKIAAASILFVVVAYVIATW